MKRLSVPLVLFASGFLLALSVSGCGGGGGNLTITVSTSGNQTTLLQGLSLNIAAEVTHSGGNPAVTWSLSNCVSNCGSLSSTTANPVTYTAPQSVAASFNVTVLATAAANTSKTASVTLTIRPADCPSGNEAVLRGQYAFVLQGGNTPLGPPSSLVAMVGSFTADGAGMITAGMEDIWPGSLTTLTIVPNGSSYSVGSDNRGCLTLAMSDNTTTRFRFAVGVISGGTAAKGRIIEFDDPSGTGRRAEGIIRKQSPTSFTTNSIQGNYAFAWVGADTSGGRIASLGVFPARLGLVESDVGEVTINHAGTVQPPAAIAGGIYNVAANGRGTIGFSLHVSCDICVNMGFGGIMYVVSAQEILFLSTPGTFPVISGEIFQQKLSSFGAGALNANAVVQVSGFKSGNTGPHASVGLVTPNGTGGVTVVLDTNDAGTFASMQSQTGSYVVNPNGRTTTSGLGPDSPILYLTDANTGLFLGNGAAVTFGSFEPQSGAPFTNASLTGTFFFGTEGAQAASRLIASGSITSDGQGHYSGTEDDSSPTGLAPSLSLPNTSYLFSATGVPSGRGTLDSNDQTVAYIISPTKLVYINTSAPKPRVVVLEK